MKIYRVQRYGNLMLTTAYLKGPQFDISIKLLFDIGSTYTVMSEKVMRRIGVAVANVQDMGWIVTGSREERLPRVRLERFDCLGQSLFNFPVLVYTFPQRVERHIAGLVGMDFLKQLPIGLPLGMPLIRKLETGWWEIRSNLPIRIKLSPQRLRINS